MSGAPGHKPDAPVSLLALLRSPEAESALKTIARTITGVQLETRVGNLKDVRGQPMNGHRPSVYLVDVRLDDASDMAALGQLIQQNGHETAFIATSDASPIQGVRQLMRLGIPDFLPQPILREDLIAALEAASRRGKAVHAPASRQRKVITFLKPCGGIGATSLAVQTACSLVNHNGAKATVCLLDLDLQFGTAALYLDVDSPLNLFNIIDAPDRLDGSFLRGLMSHHVSGVDVLPAPPMVVPLDAITPELAAQMLNIAASEYDYVVVDLTQAWTPWSHSVLSHSNLIAFITQMNVAALRHGRRLLETLRQEGLDAVPIVSVINRFERSMFGQEIGAKEAEKALGRPIDIYVDNDYKTFTQALNQGVPLAQVRGATKTEKQIRALVDRCIEKLAAQIGAPAYAK